MVSSRPLISKSFSLCTNASVTVPRVPFTIGIIAPFMFHSFFDSLAKSRYLSYFSLCFNFTQGSARTAKSTVLQALFFCLLLLGLVVWRRLGDLFICQNPIGVSAFISRTDIVQIPFVRVVQFKFIAQLLVDNLAHQVVSRLILLLD